MFTAKVEAGSTCVVFGAGMVGLGAVAGARLQGAERIICVDLSDDRLELARGQGATDTWIGGEDTVQRVLDETRGFGADYTFEATGNVKVMRQAVESARMGWGLCTVAGVAGKGETLDIVPRFLITGRRVCGSSFGGVKGRDQVPQLVQRYLDGDLDVDPFISHRITLDDVNHGFELMEARTGSGAIDSAIPLADSSAARSLRIASRILGVGSPMACPPIPTRSRSPNSSGARRRSSTRRARTRRSRSSPSATRTRTSPCAGCSTASRSACCGAPTRTRRSSWRRP